MMKLNDNVTKCSSLSKPAQNDEQKNGKHSSQESDANNKCDVVGSKVTGLKIKYKPHKCAVCGRTFQMTSGSHLDVLFLE